MTKPFENVTNDQNEKAIKRGTVVPPGAVNLSWTKTAKFSTDKNLVVIDTNTVPENMPSDVLGGKAKIAYANPLGILEDEFGNQMVRDKHALVGDVFSIDEDFSLVPGSEYKAEHVLPFMHKSRYFHVDHAGLVLQNDVVTYNTDNIKVVDVSGNDYLNDDGSKRYRIKIAAAVSAGDEDESQWAYRVLAYIDTDSNENLYLVYNKIELDDDGNFKNREQNHKELLNPIPYFKYTPEESEVVDAINRNKQIYSTKPVSLREQILGHPVTGKEGYKIYVPKKALDDPRIFQLFRWRVTCSFRQSFQVDPSTGQGVRCGVVVTGEAPNDRSRTPYAFLNLSRSDYNATNLNFYNPLTDEDAVVSETTKEFEEYWKVNFDTITNEQLRKFDILLWSPTTMQFDFSDYAQKINYFVNTVGGTLFIDCNNFTRPTGLGGLVITAPVDDLGHPKTDGPSGYYIIARIIDPDRTDSLFDGATRLGGWSFNDNVNDFGEDEPDAEYKTLSAWSSVYHPWSRMNYIDSTPNGWQTVMSCKTGGELPLGTVSKATIIQSTPVDSNGNRRRGSIIVSTYGVAETCNALYDYQPISDGEGAVPRVISYNRDTEIYHTDEYIPYVNSKFVEGAMKFLFNASLQGVAGRPLDDSDSRSYSADYAFSSDWKASWVVDGEVLSQYERDVNDFVLAPTDDASADPVWQRRLSSKSLKQLIDDVLTDDMKARIAGADRTYTIETTNSKVVTPTDVGDENLPTAWTLEYSPPFNVPVELGPHVIREELLDGRYEDGQYTHRSYPSKPYAGQVRLSYVDTEEIGTVQEVNWTVTGTALKTTITGHYTPPSTTTYESEIELSWAEHGSGNIISGTHAWEKDTPVPDGIWLWQDDNYYTSAWGPGILNWTHFGLYQRLNTGSRGEVVVWVQDFLNIMMFFGVFSYGELKLDGNYGAKTKEAVRRFQIAMGAHYVDGVVDAETLSLIGAKVLALGSFIYDNRANSGWSRFYYWPRDRAFKHAISDHNNATIYAKRSWLSGGPSIIWEMFAIKFSQAYNIHGVTVVPYAEGNTNTIMFRSIDIRNSPFSLTNYDSRTGNPIWMPHRPRDNQEFNVQFAPRYGDTLIIGIGQDGGTGQGSSRMLGIRDIRAQARVWTTETDPGDNTINIQTEWIPIEMSGTTFVATRNNVRIRLQPPPSQDNYTITQARWTDIDWDNEEVNIEFNGFDPGQIDIYTTAYQDTETTNVAYGDRFPEILTAYAMNPDTRIVSSVPETGWVSKVDGVKLLCNVDGTPTGFPDSMPPAVGPNEWQRHFTTLSLASYNTDPFVQLGFYDLARKEFVVNQAGEPEMSYIEYVTRGRYNIYIGVVSTYELDVQTPLPPADDAPKLPFKWAMPVYGVYERDDSSIGISRLPSNLGPDEPWPIAVKTGSFQRTIQLRPESEGPYTEWPNLYQGRQVTAFYSIPEADATDWSLLFGPPYSDVSEQPIILDDKVLQVRQAPIYSREIETINQSAADPVRPIFKVFNKPSLDDDWEEVLISDIEDYNLTTGEIFLKSPMIYTDPRLWKVDYTTIRRNFYLRYDDQLQTPINLNPYMYKESKKYIGRGLIVYIVPQYVKDDHGNVINLSVETTTIRVTSDPSVLDPYSPEYNPFAVQLGVIYLTTALDINELVMLDTRKRGGGAPVNKSLEELKRIVQDASYYWDIDPYNIQSYQKNGFIIIRLPARLDDLSDELKSRFSMQDLHDIIEKNMPLGVKFKIEDLDGKDWYDG